MNDSSNAADTTIQHDPGNAPLFVTAPKHLEQLLAEELSELLPEAAVRGRGGGASATPPTGRTAYCAGRTELWSRLAGRVLIEIARRRTADRDDLYRLAHELPWELHMGNATTFAIGGHSSHRAFRNPNLPRLIIKDALCDRFVERSGVRPSVDTDSPDLRLYAFVTDRETVIYVDASGGSLHRRGYRTDSVEAPLRENTAAGVLARSGWTAAVDTWRTGGAEPRAQDGTRQDQTGSASRPQKHAAAPPLLIDPMCGSGTIAIEAAMIACDIAPGILREQSGLSAWHSFNTDEWKQLREEVAARAEQGLNRWRQAGGRIMASDIESSAVEAAKANARRAGVGEAIAFECRDFSRLTAPDGLGGSEGFVVTNPPYGVRIHGRSAATEPAGGPDGDRKIYAELGRRLSQTLPDFHATILAEHEGQTRALGLQAKKLNRFFNGAMEIVAARIELGADNHYRPPEQTGGSADAGNRAGARGGLLSRSVSRENIQMVANRLRKNRRLLKKYLAKEEVTCFRLYDADIPQHAAAVDIYTDADGRLSVVLQEYAAPKEIEEETAATRLAELIHAVAEVLELPVDSAGGDEEADDSTRIHIKRRRRQRGKHQYKKSNNPVSLVRTVHESGLAFEVNFTDYLDTGLFCDQRITRRWIRERASGCNVLNLFAYTCSVSVAAAAGGAARTTSVDTSKHYLDWGRRNFELNGVSGERHYFICDDALAYLRGTKATFDLMYIDPPAFSNSKDRDADFDVQRDHRQLIEAAAERLHDGGAIVFANNLRGFRLDEELAERFDVTDWSQETLPPDFKRQAKRHHVFLLKRRV